MGTTVEFIDIDSYCRICFERNSPVENMIELKSFLPMIKMIAQTKVKRRLDVTELKEFNYFFCLLLAFE